MTDLRSDSAPRNYSHIFNLAFVVDSPREDAGDLTPAMMRAALLRHIENLDTSGDWDEAFSAVEHSCEA